MAAGWLPVSPLMAFLLVLSFVVPATKTLRAQPRDYEAVAAACHQDGKIFVALGRAVLAIPASSYAAIQAAPDAPDGKPPFRLPPPEPTQVEGCYEHPIALSSIGRGNSIFLPPTYSTATNLVSSFPRDLIPVRRIVVLRYFSDQPLKFQMANSSSREVNLMCAQEYVYAEFREGIRVCRLKRETDKPDRMRSASYFLSQDLAKTYSGEDLAFTCSSGSDQIGGLASCDLTTVVSDDLAIELDFYRPKDYTESEFPKQVAELVEQIGHNVTLARQPDYKWTK